MLAIDTNVVVRFLTGDDVEQAARARTLIETEAVLVATTVLLEAEWVLRSAYGLPAGRVCETLRAFAGLPNVTLQEPQRVDKALTWASGGMDFADALHLAAADTVDGFASFDRRLSSRAAALGLSVRML